MGLLRTQDLARLVGARTAAEVDRSGDGLLQPNELDAAVQRARQPAPAAVPGRGDDYAARSLRTLFEKRLGQGGAARPDARAKLEGWVKAERAAGSVSLLDLRADLNKLCKTPEFEDREVGTEGYKRVTEWVAGELEKAGLAPVGEDDGGNRTFFQTFLWRERFGEHRVTESRNVVGLLPGTGPEPRQAILVIAHLDNLSHAEKEDYRAREGRHFPTYEGANDNAAAVAAALEIARGLAEAGGVRKDVVFLFPSAEEEGLKGTEAFCLKPPIPLDRFAGVVNLEMIGQNSVDQVLLFGGRNDREVAENALAQRAARVAQDAGIALHPGLPNDDGEGWYGRSDHLVTANAGIPSIMIHGRTDPGHYHTADDTVEKLNMPKVQRVAELALRIVQDLGDDAASPERRGPARPRLNDFDGQVWP